MYSTKNNLDFISIETYRGKKRRDKRVGWPQEEEEGRLAKGRWLG